MSLKLVIFSLNNIFGEVGEDVDVPLEELKSIIELLDNLRIKSLVLSNTDYDVTEDGVTLPIRDWIIRHFPSVDVMICSTDNLPDKGSIGLNQMILGKYSVAHNEIVYIGNSENDMRHTANFKILFINTIWFKETQGYGFKVTTTDELKLFLELFCLNVDYWTYILDSPPVRFYSLAPATNKDAKLEGLYSGAINAAKKNSYQKEFFLKYLISSVYFSGLIDQFDYIAVYPPHSEGFGNQTMDEILSTFGKNFRKNYLIDLIIRHRDAIPSKNIKIKDGSFEEDILNQLNSICINPNPRKNQTETYVNFQKTIKNKTILVVDDFSTRGTAMEVSRVMLNRLGANVIGVSWLKFGSWYQRFEVNKRYDPTVPQLFTEEDISLGHNVHFSPTSTEAIDQIVQKYIEFMDS